MTLANCKILLKQFENIIDGTVKPPNGHKNWADVIHNAKVRAKLMKERIQKKESKLVISKPHPSKPQTDDVKSEVKKSGKK